MKIGIGFRLINPMFSIVYRFLLPFVEASLLLGAALVFGAIYYKTNKARTDALFDEYRLKLAQWQ
jgi:hypothetical protein